MIDARELRVGNWVGLKGRQFQVYSFSKTAIDEYAGLDNKDRIMTYPWKISVCSPISLTPEILEKCGFKFGVNENGTYYIDLNGIDQQLEIILSGSDFYPQLVQAPELSSEDCQLISLNKISSLHQLQNLFWCMVGKELEIKL